MSKTATIKRGDTGQVFSATLTRDGLPFNLTGYTVWFIMRNIDSEAVIKRLATVVDAVAGDVEYSPELSDIAEVGVFQVEWEAEKAGWVLTFPSDSYEKLRIIADLDGEP